MSRLATGPQLLTHERRKAADEALRHEVEVGSAFLPGQVLVFAVWIGLLTGLLELLALYARRHFADHEAVTALETQSARPLDDPAFARHYFHDVRAAAGRHRPAQSLEEARRSRYLRAQLPVGAFSPFDISRFDDNRQHVAGLGDHALACAFAPGPCASANAAG